jgi:hypothetical protein
LVNGQNKAYRDLNASDETMNQNVSMSLQSNGVSYAIQSVWGHLDE